MSRLSCEAEQELINGVTSIFVEEDAHYMSLGDKGYAICWLSKSDLSTIADQVFVKFFDTKGWPRGDEIMVANSTDLIQENYKKSYSDIKYPVLKFYDNSYLIIAWVEDLNEVYMQIIDLDGNLVGDRVKSKAFHNLAYNRDGIEIILEILFANEKLI
ncbi:MAG: hypothetical protein JJ964_12525 [Rhizobiales bacterium]|nr:hypothetical protein [Hyphomicrobiales bacterium]